MRPQILKNILLYFHQRELISSLSLFVRWLTKVLNDFVVSKVCVLKSFVWYNSLTILKSSKTSIFQLICSIDLSCDRSQILGLIHWSGCGLIFLRHLQGPLFTSRHRETHLLSLVKRTVVMVLSW